MNLRNFRHGYALGGATSPIYWVWHSMIQRCVNPKNPKYRIYGGRGITVCERWMNFENFLADMGERPARHLSIERRDNSGNYEPGNCYWATANQQQRNKRNNHVLEFNGRKATVVEWAELTGIGPDHIYKRIGRLGWSVEQALTQPVKHYV